MLFGNTAMATGKTSKFLFFDPGANQFDIQALSGAFSRFLEHVDADISFQVVRDANALNTMLHDSQVQFVMVNSEFVRTYGDGLAPLMVPTVGGDAYYRKLLIDTGKTLNKNLRGKGVAASWVAGNRDSSRVTAELASIGVAGARLIAVPKDIDALLALSFGQVDAALVTPSSVEVLRQVNPQVASSFRVIAETKKILRSPVCVVGGRPSSQQVASMVKALTTMSSQSDGRDLMRRLAFDGWTKFEGGGSTR